MAEIEEDSYHRSFIIFNLIVTQPISFNLQLSLKTAENKVLENEEKLFKKCVECDRHAQTALYKLLATRMFMVCLHFDIDI